MTPQIKLVLLGLAGFAFAKFYLHKDTITAALVGTATISTISILTAHKHNDSPA